MEGVVLATGETRKSNQPVPGKAAKKIICQKRGGKSNPAPTHTTPSYKCKFSCNGQTTIFHRDEQQMFVLVEDIILCNKTPSNGARKPGNSTQLHPNTASIVNFPCNGCVFKICIVSLLRVNFLPPYALLGHAGPPPCQNLSPSLLQNGTEKLHAKLEPKILQNGAQNDS